MKTALGYTMVFILDGHSEIGARAWSDLGNLICSRHLFRSKEVKNSFFSSENTYFHSYVRNMFGVIQSYINTIRHTTSRVFLQNEPQTVA